VTCERGFFANAASSRCEACAARCVQCSGWDKCVVCEPSTWNPLSIIQLQAGYCQKVKVPWLQAALGVVAIVAFLGLCSSCCHLTCGASEFASDVSRYGSAAQRMRREKNPQGGPETDRLLSPSGTREGFDS